MIEYKRFAIVEAIMIVILFVIGNWAASVQANNGGMVTPMPTGN